ncbi:MAG TPA: DUF805 domain-containing protein [Candidatus Humimicrobiaceae bacterium]|nr:DUF805 domain-containing protein [Candidatus Humimicrobiaceae bacterium]
MSYYLEVLKKYAVFSGRARRKEYWMFILCNSVIGFVIGLLTLFIKALFFLPYLYGLAVLIPSIAVMVRRLHDTNRSGWWWLINFIPIIGGIILIVFLAQGSQPGENQYGPNPKEIEVS